MILTMAAYLISIVFIVFIGYLSMPGSSLFSWHPFLMSLGYVGFLFQALLVFSKESSLFVQAKQKTKVNLHWIFNTVALVLILIAYACIYKNKENSSKEHLTSWHGLIGFITICYTATQWVAGHFLTIFHDKIRHIMPYFRLSVYHATSGVFLYLFITITFCLGFATNWFRSLTTVYVQYFSFVAVAILALMVTTQVATKFVQRQRLTKPNAAK